MTTRTITVLSYLIVLGWTLTSLGHEIPEALASDWLWQFENRDSVTTRSSGAILPAQDAAGGCDGIKNGTFGFHTQREKDPWWQVDLGQTYPLERLVAYNREEIAGRAGHMKILVSQDGETFRQVYQHDGTAFLGHSDHLPLAVGLDSVQARFVRLQLPGTEYFHLDEVEIFARAQNKNLALGQPATQSSVSQWSTKSEPTHTLYQQTVEKVVQRGLDLARSLQDAQVPVAESVTQLKRIASGTHALDAKADKQAWLPSYQRARGIVRDLALSNPLLDFDTILFVKRRPGSLPHLSDQYYGWWSRAGGGIYLLKDFKTDRPQTVCLTADWPAGNFLRPDLSYDGKKVLFAYCRHTPNMHGRNKVEKDTLPEDAFYQIFEMNVDGTGIRRLTRGRYDDFDARYLPDGDILFLSTRKGRFLQCTQANTAQTNMATLPDSYVRCGGDNVRPCPVFTLHAMDGDGKHMRPISAFETFEYTPAVANDGRILYCRWDYIDRFNGHFFSLWSTGPDGFNPQLVYGNYTKAPQATMEPRPIPGSDKIIFTAAAHHSITGGSLVLLDRSKGTEGSAPLTRLTPEIPFPETEENVNAYYANPYPLSEDVYLVSWSNRPLPGHTVGQAKRNQVTETMHPSNAQGLYLSDRFGNLELLYRDPDISCMYPMPLKRRERPAAQAMHANWDGPQRGTFMLQDVYQGMTSIARGTIKSLRIIGVPPKPQPHMNTPNIGVSQEDPGKFVMGTVPVEADGSAYFKVPSGVSVFFQALDSEGMAVQTMRSLTYVMPGQTLSCVGCHESREQSPPPATRPLALLRGPSHITPGPEGAWPLRFDRLVQPVLDRACVQCHNPDSKKQHARKLNLTGAKAYQALMTFADKDLHKLAFEKDASIVNDCPSRRSRLLQVLRQGKQHKNVHLNADDMDRLVTWMDTYAQKLGSFSKQQEEELLAFKHELKDLFKD